MYECFVPLATGATVIVVQSALDLLDKTVDVTLINTVPSILERLVDAGCILPTAGTVNVAGEPLKGSLVERVFATTDVGFVNNLYGPSETTTYSTWVAMKRGEPFAAHIGGPISNTQIYILDGHGEPVPVGVTGEIYIGGAGVARGYLNRAELTAERFVADPFGGGAGARMYRSGDLGRWLSNGTIEFLGRNDFQVKVRGFRIELGEIEVRLCEHPGVRKAVVAALEDVPGDKRLVAYLTVKEGEAPKEPELRSLLHASLPDYMIPSAFVTLDEFPLTPNKKVDRVALPRPDFETIKNDFTSPVSTLEKKLAGIWSDVLGIRRVGLRDNFFEMGGHSLMAVRLIDRTNRELHVNLKIFDLFENQTVEKLARKIGEQSSTNKASTASFPAGIVELRAGTTGKPLFCLGGAGNSAFIYHLLSPKLNGSYPLLGIELHQLGVKSSVLQSIEATAETIIRRIRSVQSEGPYSILGYSFGGVLAIEIARQLCICNQSLGSIILLDSYAPHVVSSPKLKRVWSTRLGKLGRMSLEQVWRYVYSGVKKRMHGLFDREKASRLD